MEIKKVINGYITKDDAGIEQIYIDITILLSDLKVYFENKDNFFSGRFGVVKNCKEPSNPVIKKDKDNKSLTEKEWKEAVYELALNRLKIEECPKCRYPYVSGWICSTCGFDYTE